MSSFSRWCWISIINCDSKNGTADRCFSSRLLFGTIMYFHRDCFESYGAFIATARGTLIKYWYRDLNSDSRDVTLLVSTEFKERNSVSIEVGSRSSRTKVLNGKGKESKIDRAVDDPQNCTPFPNKSTTLSSQENTRWISSLKGTLYSSQRLFSQCKKGYYCTRLVNV